MPLLPPDVAAPKLTPILEIRERIEFRQDRDFDRALKDDRTDYLSRIRLGARYQADPRWSGEFTWQYSLNDPRPRPRGIKPERIDASTAFVRSKDSRATITVGRQKIATARQRLIGPLEWNNVGRSFDVVRIQSGPWDAFGGSVGLNPIAKRDARVGYVGYRGTIGLTALIFKHDRVNNVDSDIWTGTHWWTKAIDPRTTGDIEVAIQGGKTGNVRQEGWALSAKIERKLRPKLSGFVEINAASGGQGDVNRTFDNLYATDHPEYGNLDVTSWKNLNELAIGGVYRSDPRWTISFSWRSQSLRDTTDAWYGAQGLANRINGANFADAQGRFGRDIGREWNLEAAYAAKSNLVFTAGVAFLAPGRFVQKVSGSRDPQRWAFAMMNYRF